MDTGADYVTELVAPQGYATVEWADEVVHAIDLDDLNENGPTWRSEVVCGRSGPGVSSDAAGPDAMRPGLKITCWECIAVLI